MTKIKPAKYTLKDFNEQFPSDDACLEFLKQARWPSGVYCPKCQKITNFYRVRGRKVYECQFCGRQIHPAAYTIFDHSSTPLRSWFHAFFLMSSTRTGISAKQLQRELGVTYKTAWRIFNQIRMIMDEEHAKMKGKIEVDETYFGGKGHKQGRSTDEKTAVFGMVERDGELLTKIVPNVKARTLLPIIWTQANQGSTIFSDELGSYNNVAKLGYEHEKVEHAAKEYARGIVHVNTIEGIWSTIKRGIDGTHHAVSPKYLSHYLDAYGYRYNHRKDSLPIFLSLLMRVIATIPSVVVQQPEVNSQTALL